MRNTWRMSPMCFYLHAEILESGWFLEGLLSYWSHVSHELRVVTDISNSCVCNACIMMMIWVWHLFLLSSFSSLFFCFNMMDNNQSKWCPFMIELDNIIACCGVRCLLHLETIADMQLSQSWDQKLCFDCCPHKIRRHFVSYLNSVHHHIYCRTN